MREKHKLNEQEQIEFRKLRFKTEPGDAIEFWGGVAHRRGLDYTTIIASAQYFTALPYGHGKHWCFPMQLKCKRRVKYTDPVPDIAALLGGSRTLV